MLENVLVLGFLKMVVAMSGSQFGKFMLLVLGVCFAFIVCAAFVVCVALVVKVFACYISSSNGSQKNSSEEKSYVATYMQKRAIECASVCVVCTVIAFLLMLLGGVYGIVEGKI